MIAASRTALVLAFVLAFAPRAEAAAPPMKPSYVSFQIEGLRSAAPATSTLAGFSVDWGFFQNRYIATGTRIGVSRNVGDITGGTAISIMGGPQFHVPLGAQLLLIPALNLGLRIANSGLDYGALFDLTLAFRQDDLYIGVAGQTPVYMRGQLFPSIYSANLVVGFYY